MENVGQTLSVCVQRGKEKQTSPTWTAEVQILRKQEISEQSGEIHLHGRLNHMEAVCNKPLITRLQRVSLSLCAYSK